ncbi:hypothetical protein ES319_A08G128700v1 [Gossypium barbadense]|uniref:DUF789 family protein n=2 Tax=Gossypium TaxID=3633 RepID=A0A5J5UR92_GOSBA|nr:uncharacterized protein LOC107926854 isoform X3 [Gossypium hirsutum]KAB2070003.1 hypothetical protein ES319_A08G128700v1 [Gossypium barbadense]KAB2070005.1 hypothetical protein ES319_A08G128700v1 [Gossypium barbadense]
MSNSGGFAVTRTHTEDRFYNPPVVRRQMQLLQQQQLERQQHQQLHRTLQKELRRPLKDESRVNSVDSLSESRTDLDESTLSAAQSSPEVASLTNLDRLMESVTPLVPAQCFSEAKMRGWRTHEVNLRPYFCLGDLWECFSEWSVYGVGVPLLLNGSDSVKQYYVPSLSGIQLFVDQQRPRRASEDSDVESSRETSSAGSSDCETDRRLKGGVVGAREKHNSQGTNKPPTSSFSDEMEVSSLASQFPDIRMYRSCDLLPASWISVAWYPIYRIPMGPTLQNLDASFLTFHSLSTHSQTVTGKNQLHSPASSSRKVCGFDASSQISLPVFGLASYKLRGSILTSNCSQEWQQASSLLHAADNWLHGLRVHLPDFQFFVSHNSKR